MGEINSNGEEPRGEMSGERLTARGEPADNLHTPQMCTIIAGC